MRLKADGCPVYFFTLAQVEDYLKRAGFRVRVARDTGPTALRPVYGNLSDGELLFWISAGFTLYVYVGYPVLLWLLQAVVRRCAAQQPVEPSVSLLVAAYNEAAVIADKIRNSLCPRLPGRQTGNRRRV